VAALLTGLLAGFPAPATAGCTEAEQVSYENGIAQIHVVQVCSNGSETDGGTENSANTPPPRESGLDTVCVREALAQGANPFEFCDVPSGAAETTEVIQLTPAIVASAFARIPLPASKLMVQPPNGRTLVNFATNFYTETEPFTRSVTLLGQRVELSIRPAAFAWRFGDGESTSTSSPGSAYPDLEITHAYLRKGRFAPSVDTTYTATYRVLGGPAQPVPGSVTIPGESVSLEVVSASPRLVG
jgi:hypothetical protein